MRDNMIREITELEWQMFDQVQNRGGRASCQDDWQTFSIMRKSQLTPWSSDTLQAYRDDLWAAKVTGRNLLMEKYARMMESTVPEEYAQIRHLLPSIEPEKHRLVEEIAQIQISEMELLSKQFPRVASTMRPLRSRFDSPVCTSLETYLKGELCTYSLRTLEFYRAQLLCKDINFSYAILNQTALEYGCSTLEELEQRLSR